MIEVALDIASLRKPGHDRGLGRYTRQLIAFFSADARFRAVPIDVVVAAGTRYSEFAEVFARTATLARKSWDIFHTPTPYHVAPFYLQRTVVSVQDTIPLELGEYARTGIKAKLFYNAASRARVIVVNTQFTRARVVELLNVDEANVFSAPLPVTPGVADWAHDHCRLPDELRRRRFVAAAVDARSHDPRKRTEWLFALAKRLATLDIAVVAFGSNSEVAPEPVIGLGRLSDSMMCEVLAHARAFVFTSAYEGQGLPPLEAMALGTPVVAFDNTAVSEVVDGGGVLLPEPASMHQRSPDPPREVTERLCDAVRAICDDDGWRAKLSAAAIAQARLYTPERFYRALGAAYARAAGSG